MKKLILLSCLFFALIISLSISSVDAKPPPFAPNSILDILQIGPSPPYPQQVTLLDWPLTNTIIPTLAEDDTAAFTRASAATVWDFEKLKPVLSGEARFSGARRVENLLGDSDDFTLTGDWDGIGTASVTNNNTLNFPAEIDIVRQTVLSGLSLAGKTFAASVTLSGSGTITLSITRVSGANSTTAAQITLSSIPTRYSLSHAMSGLNTGIRFQILRNTGDTATTVLAHEAQLEEVTGQANQNPSEYVSSDVLSSPWHGTGSDIAVKYFTWENGNVVNSNIVTEAQGSAIAGIDGYLQEEARTNKQESYNIIGPDQDGSELVTGTDSDFSGAGNWTGNFGTFGVNSIVAGKAYGLGDGGNDYMQLDLVLTVGKVYRGTVKARLNAGASTEIRFAGLIAGNYFTFTPTGTEQTFTGTFVADDPDIRIGSTSSAGNGIAFEFDDVSVVEIGGTDLADGTFYSGGGTGAQCVQSGGWQNALQNITCSGGTDGESSVTITEDLAKLASAGLDYISSAGKVYKAVAGASADMFIDFDGALTAADYVIHAWVRGNSAADDDVKFRTDNVDGNAQDLTNSYVRYSEVITAQAGDLSRIVVAAGDTIYFLLQGAEIGPAVSSEIVTQGSSVTRAIDDLRLPVADGVNFRQSEGMLFADWTPTYLSGGSPSDAGIISIIDSLFSILIWADVDGKIIATDDSSFPSYDAGGFTAGTLYKLFTRWSSGTNFQVGYDSASGTAVAYDGAFGIGSNYRIGYNATESFNIRNIRVLRRDKGEAFGEDQTSGLWEDMINYYESLAAYEAADDYYLAEAM